MGVGVGLGLGVQTYIHTCIHTHIPTHIHTYTHTYIHTYIAYVPIYMTYRHFYYIMYTHIGICKCLLSSVLGYNKPYKPALPGLIVTRNVRLRLLLLRIK